jgi:hypothetical protein
MCFSIPAGIRSRRLMLWCISATCALGMPAQTQAENLQAPADFPEIYYRQAEALGKKILHVDSAQSLVVIEVHRAGAFSRLGHDHVVASHDVSGYASIAEGLADLYVPLEQLVVDEPGLRTEAGLDPQPSREDIADTRRNMLTQTLDTAHFPYALIHIARTDANRPALNVAITLHGITRSHEVPALIKIVRNGIVVDGKMSFKQSDFGITPLSVFGGVLQVQDKLNLRFHISAQEN